MKRHYVVLALVVGAAGAGGVWWYTGHSAASAGKAASAQEDTGSVLVKTAPVSRESIALTMNVFGEVNPGKVEAISFPQAGQLAQLVVVSGQRLHRGDPIATMVSDPAAQTAYHQAATALGFAQRELRRNQDLLALQLATQSQVDAAGKQVQDAQSALDAQRKLGGEQATARLLAPFDGVVTSLPVAQGERVQAGVAVAQIGRSDSLRVQLSIEPAQSGQLRTGMPVTISAMQDSARRIRTVIAEIQDLVDPKTQMVSALAMLPASQQARLLSGMRVQAVIELGQRQAWSVPRAAVLTDDQGAYLFQVSRDKARRIGVVKLVETGSTFGVEGKLDPALPVVVLGNYELHDGMSVRGGAR